MRITFFAPGAQRGNRRHALSALFAGALALLALSGTAQARCADVALVLAIDASGSINAAEFALQQQGYAAAFRAPHVQSALAAAGTVDIGVVIWGDTELVAQVLPLQRLRSRADAIALSSRIGALPREAHGNTGIGRGVSVALDLLTAPGVCAARRLVNVSGDGLETLSPRPRKHVPLRIARQRAGDLGITINALAIETDVVDLADWYRDRLITGPDAFVMRVGGFESFAEAIAEKLAREIRPPQLASESAEDRPVPPGADVTASLHHGH